MFLAAVQNICDIGLLLPVITKYLLETGRLVKLTNLLELINTDYHLLFTLFGNQLWKVKNILTNRSVSPIHT